MTSDVSLCADAIKTMLTVNATVLGLQDIWYGDQSKIPRTPCVCVETGPVLSNLAGAPMRLKHDLSVFLLVYFAKVQDEQVTRRLCDQKMEQIIGVLHTDHQLGGLVISSWVTRKEPGFARRSGALFRAARITWSGISLTNV